MSLSSVPLCVNRDSKRGRYRLVSHPLWIPVGRSGGPAVDAGTKFRVELSHQCWKRVLFPWHPRSLHFLPIDLQAASGPTLQDDPAFFEWGQSGVAG